MSEEKVDVNKKIDDLEAATKKYASKDTVISIGGYEFTPAKLMVLFTLVSSLLGGLYGVFEVYKDYVGMKKKIAEYVTPDLEGINKKIELLEVSTNKAVEYTNEIRTDLKADIRRIEKVVEGVETSSKTDQRATDASIKEIKRDVDSTLKEVRRYSDQSVKEMNSELVKNQKETTSEIRSIRKEIDDKIKKALDNPLANQ